MGLAIASFARRLFSPPAAAPLVREPNRRWARGAAPSTLLRLKVAEVVQETPSTRTFVFEEGAIEYRAGQHLTLVAELDGRTHRRCYSFSSAPGSRPAITVKRVEGGVLSNWLHDHVTAGDTLRATPASGRFTVADDACSPRHAAMVAGGVGITPVLSMTEALLRDEKDSRVTLLYGSRCETEIIFRDRLEAMQAAFPARLRVVMALDEATADWKGLVGSLDGRRVAEATAGSDVQEWYVCGPLPMMDSVVAALQEQGIPADRVHLERFQYAATTTLALPAAPAALVFGRSGKAVAAGVGTTILEAAEQAGIALPSSCRMGGCGACKVKVVGRVVAAEPNCLTEGERADGYALACCSYGDGRVELPDF
ncbi:MAG: 2Fe-2S iron-sulfur cluster-binding protein [Candidatus Binatia bacterium]